MDRFRAESPGNKEGAVGILSHLKIVEAVNHGAMDQRLTRSAFHAIVATKAPGPTANLPIIGLHLHARETLADEETRMSELPALFAIADLFKGRPHLIAGDFNACHPQQVIDMEKLRQKTRDRIAKQGNEIPRDVVRAVLERGYMDAHALHHEPREFGTTFTTSHPAARVDYIFITPDLAPHLKSCEVFKPEMARFASDHFPVVAQLDL
jgi:endonuclease/exonuclease/phosphatase family metal-dependent hydrolase